MDRRSTAGPGMLIKSPPLLICAALWLALAFEPVRAQMPSPNTDTPVELAVPGGELKIHFAPDEAVVPRERILDWISRSAGAVSLYFGRFPLPEANILIVTTGGRGVQGGRAFGGRNAYLRVVVGRESDAEDLARDWVMVHEMIHLAVPLMDDRHDWFTEGIAVYVESVARLQAGDLTEEDVWSGFVKGMPHGVPRAGDKGLDNTPTWGRTYWGGAIFCLFADLELRKRTDGRKTLQHALRGMLARADFRTRLPIRDALAAADEATGTTVMMDLYEVWRATAVDPNLPDLWKRLGVRVEDGAVAFNDGAPLAKTRREIGRPPQD